MIEINKHFDEIDELDNGSGFRFNKSLLKYGLSFIVVVLFIVAIYFALNREEVDRSIVPTTTVSEETIDFENELFNSLSADQRNCVASRAETDQKRWVLSIATLVCDIEEVDTLNYALFDMQIDLNDTYQQQAQVIVAQTEELGEVVRANVAGTDPCSTYANESGRWGTELGEGQGGDFICVSVPHPTIVWTHSDSNVLGEAELKDGTIDQLISWWKIKAGPK